MTSNETEKGNPRTYIEQLKQKNENSINPNKNLQQKEEYEQEVN